jgi:hypothetical protein
LQTLHVFRDEARMATVALTAWAILCLCMVPALPAGAVRLLGLLAALAAVDAAERAWHRRRRAWRAYGFSAGFMVTGFAFHQVASGGPVIAALLGTAVFAAVHVVVASWVRGALSSAARERGA